MHACLHACVLACLRRGLQARQRGVAVLCLPQLPHPGATLPLPARPSPCRWSATLLPEPGCAPTPPPNALNLSPPPPQNSLLATHGLPPSLPSRLSRTHLPLPPTSAIFSMLLVSKALVSDLTMPDMFLDTACRG